MSPAQADNTSEMPADGHPETLKYLFETFKHLSTLSAGTLVLITAVIDRLFEAPEHIYLVGIAFVSLIGCMAGCLLLMAASARAVGHLDELTNKKLDVPLAIGSLLVAAGFVIGLGSFATFVLLNSAA